jgi:predicted lipoprotein with Yx(FWY)xxD motif
MSIVLSNRAMTLVVGLALLMLAGCGADTGTGGGGTTTTGGSTTTIGGMVYEVHAADSDLGPVVVNPSGLTLYVFANDTNGVSTCYDQCADLWPAVPGDTGIGSDLDSSMFTITTRTDGTEQLTMNGHPLYRFAPDDTPGETGGQGFNGVWFAAGTDGTMIEAPAPSTTAPGDDDYGYNY